MPTPAGQIVDEILVLDAQDGRSEAFDQLVARWQKRLWRHAFQLTDSSESAWDITQESWLDIVKGLSRLNDPARFGAWAYRIVSRRAYDWNCRRGRECPSVIESGDSPDTTSERKKREAAVDVHEILRRLPARSKTVLSLYYLDGLSLAEIAAVLGTPEGTVKSRLHAARTEFRRQWSRLADIPRDGGARVWKGTA